MKKKISVFSVIMCIISGFVAALGIAQLVFYIIAQVDTINTAKESGALDETIDKYLMQQVVPEILSITLVFLGLSAIVLACGLIYNKVFSSKNEESDFDLEMIYDEDLADFKDLNDINEVEEDITEDETEI